MMHYTAFRRTNAKRLQALILAFALIPIVPSVAASASGPVFSFGLVGINVHSHVSDVLRFCEDVRVFDVAQESVVAVQTQKVSDIPPNSWTQNKIPFQAIPHPINFFPRFWQFYARQELPSDFVYAPWHPSDIYHVQGEPSLAISKFQRRITDVDVSALNNLEVFLATLKPKPSENNQTIGKIREQQVREPDFLAQPRWQPVSGITGGGILLNIIGRLLLNCDHVIIYFIGALLVTSGISITLCGPSIWFLWRAP
jgi:hypothetical protein